MISEPLTYAALKGALGKTGPELVAAIREMKLAGRLLQTKIPVAPTSPKKRTVYFFLATTAPYFEVTTMASVNKALIVGHLGADPETRYTASGDAVCNFRVATSESWTDKESGEKREITEWHRIVMYRKLAEIAGKYLKKGALVYLEGKIKTRKWTDKDGVERYSTEIEADSMQMLGGKPDGAKPADSGDYAPAPRKAPEGSRQGAPRPTFDDLGDDIPFMAHARGIKGLVM